MTACVLGVDTSNYTTSLCVISAETGQLLAETRQLLPVDAGERGLRQSEALFFHVQHLPVLMSELMGRLQSQSIRPEWSAVGVSVRPRPFAASYMPVFHWRSLCGEFRAGRRDSAHEDIAPRGAYRRR